MSNRNSRQKFEIWILLIYLVAFDTLGCELVFIAFGTIYIVFFRNEGFGAYRLFTGTANKTFFMPLSCLVLHFFHAYESGKFRVTTK